MRFLIGLLNFQGDARCNDNLPYITEQDVEAHFFGQRTDGKYSAKMYIDECSYGKTIVDRANSHIMRLTLPCSGRYAGWVNKNATWNAPNISCTTDDFYGIINAADQAADAWAESKGVDITSNIFRFYVYNGFHPRFWNLNSAGTTDCEYSEASSFGCGTNDWFDFYGDAEWSKGCVRQMLMPMQSIRFDGQQKWFEPNNYVEEVASDAKVTVHELGHQMWMNHAQESGSPTSNDPSEAYGDFSSLMGTGNGGHRCFNTPHTWQQGWLSPQEVPASRLSTSGARVTLTVPVQQSSDKSGVRLVASWAPLPADADTRFTHLRENAFYFGYRRATGPDAGLADPPWSSSEALHKWEGLFVYAFSGTGSHVDGYTYLRQVLEKAGDAWTSEAAVGIVARLVSLSPDSAQLQLCRFMADAATECAA